MLYRKLVPVTLQPGRLRHRDRPKKQRRGRRADDERDEVAPFHCSMPPVLTGRKDSIPRDGRTPEAIGARQRRMSGLPPIAAMMVRGSRTTRCAKGRHRTPPRQKGISVSLSQTCQQNTPAFAKSKVAMLPSAGEQSETGQYWLSDAICICTGRSTWSGK